MWGRVALQRNLGILGHFNFWGADFDQDSSIKHFSALNAERMKLIQGAMGGLGCIKNELILCLSYTLPVASKRVVDGSFREERTHKSGR